jgi:hypothetical protein
VTLPPPIADDLLGLARSRVSAEAREWLGGVASEIAAPLSLRTFHMAFARTGRTVGTDPVVLDASAQAALAERGGPAPMVGWGTDELVRAALLMRAVGALETDAQAALVSDLYYRGEVRERQAVLRVLAWLPQPERFAELAVEACRSHVQTVFDAIACWNPFPAEHFSEAAFNQMVLKAVFTETPVTRISGLARRVGPDLARMTRDYADERRAAGRPVPKDCDILLSLAGHPE